jgi:hypothetical protein
MALGRWAIDSFQPEPLLVHPSELPVLTLQLDGNRDSVTKTVLSLQVVWPYGAINWINSPGV